MKEQAGYHRRTLDEECERCGAPPDVVCVDLRYRDQAVPTKSLHRGRP